MEAPKKGFSFEVTFPDAPSAGEMTHLLRTIRQVGGVVMEASIVTPEVTSQISRATFQSWGENNGYHKSTLTDTWNAAETAQLLTGTNGRLDLGATLARLRLAETQETDYPRLLPRRVGEKAWNIFANLINENLIDNPDVPLVLPWDPEIHPRLRHTGQTRLQAQRALAEKYADQYAATTTPVE